MTKTKKDIDQIIIRSYPKVIFLYPVLLTSFICGAVQSFTKEGINSDFAEILGMVFFAVLCFNLLVISFEFSRFKTMAIIFFIMAVVFLLLYLSTRWEVFPFLRDLLEGLHLRCSTTFYISLGGYLLLIFGAVYINTRFNYWVIHHNEILHKEGFLGDVRRFPSPNLKMTKEINDVFEFLLLGAGRVVLFPASEKQAIVLDHVLRVNAVEKAIQELLSSLSVEIAGHDHTEEHPIGG